MGLPGQPVCSAKIWKQFLPSSSKVRMATGYITSDAVIELKKIAELNDSFNFDLFIGMHYFELFTKTQYDAVKELSEFLSTNQRGTVYLSPKTKFHGKMYSFLCGEKCIASAIGSSNLGSFIGTSNDLYEADCIFQAENECSEINNNISRIIANLGKPFDEITIEKFNQTNDILDGEYGVTKLETAEVNSIFRSQTSLSFVFPLKTEAKSNLNVYFGKGRKTPRGMIQPRPWYEVEIIVPHDVALQNEYPKGQIFNVCTDDGWSFLCSINGDYGKNFRSASDLKILGKWIKGQMEKAGVLKIGSIITEATLDAFGKHSLRLTKTENNNYWTLEMI